MSLVQSDRPSDVMREIQRQGKFQLCNIELFKELAIMKLKEPEEGWGTFEWEEWPAGIRHRCTRSKLVQQLDR